MSTKHFLTLSDLGPDTLRRLLTRAIELKKLQKSGKPHTPLQGKVLAMIFEKASTRTRLSFEAGMVQLGGHAIFLSPGDTQIGRGEPIADTARVLSRMVDIIMIRTFGHDKVEQLARYSSIPVINALTDRFHPCQLLADIQTYIEHRGEIRGRTVAWIGDGNNMCNSFMEAAKLLDFQLNIACPKGYEPPPELVKEAGTQISILREPIAAAKDADLVVTDVWSSMGKEQEQKARLKAFAGYEVDSKVMAAAKKDALFMHCLPAHRGEEVSAEVIDGPQSVVWDEAENRLHSQKALLEYLLSAK
ncbi:MAG TPA: ornithine carbamoyltransferase [Gammaproteobacteria bacterium]|nr:ornithine carbamoyltransferase [Gammaproteobacteria bacterium]